MAKVERWVCDRCKRTSNGLGSDGWIMVEAVAGRRVLIVHSVEDGGAYCATGACPGRGEQQLPTEARHYCGVGCAMAEISDALRELSQRSGDGRPSDG